MASSTTSNRKHGGDESGQSAGRTDDETPSASFSSLPTETVRKILSILLKLQPNKSISTYLVDKRYYRLVSSIKRETCFPAPHGNDNLSRILDDPRFNHDDFRSPIRKLKMVVTDDDDVLLPYQIPIISRLNNLTSFSLRIQEEGLSFSFPPAFMPALARLPHLVSFGIDQAGYEATPFQGLQMRRDLPQVRQLRWSGPYPPFLLAGSPALERVELWIPDPRSAGQAYRDLPWSTLLHLVLVPNDDDETFPALDLFIALLSSATLANPLLPLRRLELLASLHVYPDDDSPKYFYGSQLLDLLRAIDSTHISYLRLPLGTDGAHLTTRPRIGPVQTLALDYHCHMSMDTHRSLVHFLASCPRLNSVHLKGLLPYEEGHPVDLERILGGPGALGFEFPHLTAILYLLQSDGDVRNLSWHCPQEWEARNRTYRWSRSSRKEKFRLEGWTMFEVDR